MEAQPFLRRRPGIGPDRRLRIRQCQQHRLQVEGLPQAFLADWATNGARFPRGIDLVLCAGDRLAALPRTTRIEEAG